MSGNERKEFENAVWMCIEELIRKKGIKQSQLIRKCGEIGMPITQPELSKLYNKTKKISLYELTAISKALDISVDFFMSDFVSRQDDLLDSRGSKKLLSKADNDIFSAYLGQYYIYYNVTVEQKSKVQRGRMTISQENEYCKVELLIYTGTYRNKKEVVKKYEGRMLITIPLSGAYIVLRNDLIGELCFMTMRYQTFTTRQLECRLALCLTIGAGANKLPTVHRMLISRKALDKNQVEDIQPYLDLYGNVIHIEKNKARELRNALEKEDNKKELDALWRRLPEKEYYEVSVELLKRYLHLDRKEFASFVANLLSLADTEPYSKIRESDDAFAYAMLEKFDIKNDEECCDGTSIGTFPPPDT